MNRVSVIVVSRGRPARLGLCLTGIAQLCHSAFEIVVVADRAGLETVSSLGLEARIKSVRFEDANVSAARNAGISLAAGEILAFIDDDAVPEPSWLDHLAAPFSEAEIAATGGYVIGRRGIGFQYTARAVNRLGETCAVEAAGSAPFEPAPPAGFVTKTEGTNMAFRRDVLAALGGFDPVFRFYLDETDVNLRLAKAGGRTVLVPLAQVHHGFAASAHRAADRSPRDLVEIGASTAAFLRRHGDGQDRDAAFAAVRAAQRRRLIRHMVAGGVEPGDVDRLLAGLESGFREGARRGATPLAPIGPATEAFLPFRRDDAPRAARVFAGRPWDRRRLRARAAAAMAQGEIVTVMWLSPTALPHWVRFHPGGWWEQTGGLFGPAAGDEPAFRWQSFAARVAREKQRFAGLRQCRRKDTFSQ